MFIVLLLLIRFIWCVVFCSIWCNIILYYFLGGVGFPFYNLIVLMSFFSYVCLILLSIATNNLNKWILINYTLLCIAIAATQLTLFRKPTFFNDWGFRSFNWFCKIRPLNRFELILKSLSEIGPVESFACYSWRK